MPLLKPIKKVLNDADCVDSLDILTLPEARCARLEAQETIAGRRG